MGPPAIKHGVPESYKGCTWSAHTTAVNSDDEVREALRMIHSDVEERGADKDTSKAIAAFSYAYRVGQGVPREGFDDGVEAGAGAKLLHILRQWDLRNVVLAVTRKDRSIVMPDVLGPRKFKRIVACARLLVEREYISKLTEEGQTECAASVATASTIVAPAVSNTRVSPPPPPRFTLAGHRIGGEEGYWGAAEDFEGPQAAARKREGRAQRLVRPRQQLIDGGHVSMPPADVAGGAYERGRGWPRGRVNHFKHASNTPAERVRPSIWEHEQAAMHPLGTVAGWTPGFDAREWGDNTTLYTDERNGSALMEPLDLPVTFGCIDSSLSTQPATSAAITYWRDVTQYGSDQAAGAGEYRDIGALDLVVELPKLDRRARAQVTDMREPREVIWRVLQCVRALLFGARAVSADWPTCRAMVASPLFMNSLQEVDARTLRRDQVERVLGLLAKEGITPPGIAQSKLTAEKELLAWIERVLRAYHLVLHLRHYVRPASKTGNHHKERRPSNSVELHLPNASLLGMQL